MKSDFSRFLHPTPSYSGLTRISRWNKFANLVDLDTPVKPECDSMRTDASLKPDDDSLCAGRSMVEMLGVLAIIGVLSVGAISGYSKAMMKYKLNKQAEQLNTVLNAVDRNLHSFDNIKVESGTGIHITSYFIKMGEIPQEMIKDNNDTIFDSFNTKINITKEYFDPTSVYVIYMSPPLTTSSSDNLAICQNIITVAKEHADSLYTIYAYSYNNNKIVYAPYYGDKYCSGNNCIRNINLDDIHKICTQHIGVTSGAGFSINWHA
jgi:type II secretory pathway pseudopilin PulG